MHFFTPLLKKQKQKFTFTILLGAYYLHSEVGVSQNSLQVSQVAQIVQIAQLRKLSSALCSFFQLLRNLRCALCLLFQRLRNLRL